MAKQKTRNKKLQFDTKTQRLICQRDILCIFCAKQYHMKSSTQFAYDIPDIMHYVNKSAGGLGIPENGVLGCRYHHMLLDNGNKGLRSEMLEMMREHLKMFYPDWNEEDLYYKKYDF